MRRWLGPSVASALALSGCSLVFDFSSFHAGDVDSGLGTEDTGAGTDGAVDLDAGDVDAGDVEVDAGDVDAGEVEVDAGDVEVDAGVGLDSGGPRDVGPPRDAGVSSCPGLTALGPINLGPIAGLPAIIGNSVFVVRAVGSDLAVAWQDTSNAVHFRSWRVDAVAGTATPTTSVDGLGTALSNATLGLGRDGMAWVVWIYPPTPSGAPALVRCADGAALCTAEPRPTGAVSPYAFAQGATSFAYVHSAETSLEWRATALGGSASLLLADQPGHIVTPDALATGGGSYVAILSENDIGTERVTFVWFGGLDAGGSASRSPSRVVDPVNRIYLTYDAATETAVGVAADLASGSPMTHLLVATRGAGAERVDSWAASSPRPLVSRGDGTIYVADATGYGLRSLASPGTVAARPGDPGAVGAAVVVDGLYGYVAIHDLAADQLQLVPYECR